MTWLDDETSVEDSRPREGYEFTMPGTIAQVYRLASGDEDVTIDGKLFRGTPRGSQVSRSPVPVAQNSSGTRALTITVPLASAVAQRYLRAACPPRSLGVVVYRQQARSGEAEVIWRGEAESGEVGEEDALELVFPSLLALALERRMPNALAGRQCPHVLYDANCRANPAATQVSTTIVSVDWDVVTVAGMGGNPDDWAKFGDLIHPTTGEQLTINSQVGNVLTLALPLLDAAGGQAVIVRAGCAHDITTCRTKFNNQPNYGGAPAMPFDNPHLAQSKLGIISQT